MSNSEQKSFYTFGKIQKHIISRRIWLAGLMTLYFILYYPVAVAMQITRSNQSGMMRSLSTEMLRNDRLSLISAWMGMRSSFLFVIVFLGILAGIQEFSYLFSSDKIDFYESQPLSRKARFGNLYLNGILLFSIPLIVNWGLAVLISIATNSLNAITLEELLYQLFRILLVFLASYSIGILSVMLTGNLIVAVLMSIFLEVFGWLGWYLTVALGSTFYITWAFVNSQAPRGFLLSTLYNTIYPSVYSSMGVMYARYPLMAYELKNMVSSTLPGDLCNIACAVLIGVCDLMLFSRRKMEAAGESVLFRPLRAVIKIIVSVNGGIITALLVLGIFGINNRVGIAAENQLSIYVYVFAGALFMCFLAAGVMQSIYDFNIRRFFGSVWSMLLSGALCLLILGFYHFDLSGYDRWVPSPEKTAYASLVVYDGFPWFNIPYEADSDIASDSPYDTGISPYSTSGGSMMNSNDYAENNMRITDLKSLTAIASAGMENMTAAKQSGKTAVVTDAGTNEMAASGWNAKVIYKLKNGKTAARNIRIPYSVDPELMDKVTGQEEYIRSVFPVFLDDSLRNRIDTEIQARQIDISDPEQRTIILNRPGGFKGVTTASEPKLYYYNDADSVTAVCWFYPELSDALREDLLKMSFSDYSQEDAFGNLNIEFDDYNGYYLNYEMPVYAGYEKTIKVLEENGIRLASVQEIPFESIVVRRWSESYEEKIYKDANEIRSILDACMQTNSGLWKTDSNWEKSLDVIGHPGEAYYETRSRYEFGDGCSLTLKTDLVPDFVKADFPKE